MALVSITSAKYVEEPANQAESPVVGYSMSGKSYEALDYINDYRQEKNLKRTLIAEKLFDLN